MRYIIATHNTKKLTELARILSPLGIEAVTGEAVGCPLPEVEETGTTFLENARLKAASACTATGLPAIADDSGLMVDALDGAPGVYSARYAGEDASDADRNQKLLRELRDVPASARGARFVSAICCVFPDGGEVAAEGMCPGSIAFETRGEGGFGYDPLFLTASGKTYGELTAAEKDAISHRGQALRLFAQRLAAYVVEHGAGARPDGGEKDHVDE